MNRFRIINENRDFIKMYRKANSRVHPLLVTYCMKNRLGENRIGITASKKVGGAVQRNRAKRVIRAAYRGAVNKPYGGYDILFVARSRTPYCKSTDIQKVMEEHFVKLLR